MKLLEAGLMKENTVRRDCDDRKQDTEGGDKSEVKQWNSESGGSSAY